MNQKRKKEKMNVVQVMKKTLKEMLITFRYGVIEELDKISIAIQILIPVLIARSGLNLVGMLLVSICITAFTKYIKEVSYKLNHVTERGFPIPTHRYTRVDENGFVGIEEEETQEAILYLLEVEQYLKSKGWL